MSAAVGAVDWNRRIRGQLVPGRAMAFRCECGDPECERVLYLDAGEYDRRHQAGSVKADRHPRPER